jgi:Holliday junction resolvasome RuvABC endonuclease subunit
MVKVARPSRAKRAPTTPPTKRTRTPVAPVAHVAATHRLFALDTSSSCVGWALFVGGELRQFGKLPLTARGAAGLVQFADWLTPTLVELHPDEVAVEWPFPGRNPKTYGMLMQVIAVVMIGHFRYRGAELPKSNQVEAHAVKRLLKRPRPTGAQSVKQLMVEYINTRFGLQLKFKANDKTKRISDDDIADAIAVGAAWFVRREKEL